RAGPDLAIVRLMNDGTWDGDPATAEAAYISVDSLVAGSVDALERDLAKLTALRWVHTFSIGLDLPLYGVMLDRGITLTNGAGTQGPPIAQYVVLMMLFHAKGMARWLENQQTHRWARHQSEELTGKTVGLFGVGGIGAEVAKVTKA